MQLTWVRRELHPRRVFRISRARRTAVENVFVRLERDGIAGHGEASPNAYYDETCAGVGAPAVVRARNVKSTRLVTGSWCASSVKRAG